MPMRKPYQPMGQTGAASAAGGPPGNMPLPVQGGRTDPQPPMPMAGSSRPQPGAPGAPGAAPGADQPQTEELPLPMGPGGPMSPMNAQAQGVLQANRQPKRVPMAQEDIFGGQGGGPSGPPGAAPGSQLPQGQLQPDIMMKLMQMLQGGGAGGTGGRV